MPSNVETKPIPLFVISSHAKFDGNHLPLLSTPVILVRQAYTSLLWMLYMITIEPSKERKAVKRHICNHC